MRLFTSVMLSMVIIVAWLSGCVDVPSNGPTPPVFESEFRFFNADKDLASANILFDLGPAVSGVAFKETNSHQTYPSGARVGAMDGSDTIRVAVTSEQRSTVVLLPKTGATREFVKLIERRIYDEATLAAVDVTLPINDSTGAHISDTTFANVVVGGLRVVHGVPATTIDISIVGQSTSLADGLLIENRVDIAGAEYRDIGAYTALLPGDYTITLSSPDDGSIIASTQVTIGNIRRTTVAVQSASGVELVNIEDN